MVRRKRTWTDTQHNFWVLALDKNDKAPKKKAHLYTLKGNPMAFDLNPPSDDDAEEEHETQSAGEPPPPPAPVLALKKKGVAPAAAPVRPLPSAVTVRYAR